MLDCFDLTGKIALVTGASKGLGFVFAKALAKAGASLFITARSEDELQANAREVAGLGVSCDWMAMDITREEDVVEMVARCVARYGRIDILVNNAGLSMRAMFKDLDLKVIRTLMDVNFWGTVHCTKFALPYLLETKGSVVGVISVAGLSALPARTGYSASKYAIRGFLDAIRMEHLKDGLNVLVFAPGYISSNVRKAALTADGSPQGDTPLDEGRLMSAEECAKRLSRALRRRRSQVILSLLGRATVHAHYLVPRLLDKWTYSYVSREPGSPFK